MLTTACLLGAAVCFMVVAINPVQPHAARITNIGLTLFVAAHFTAAWLK